MFKAIGHFLRFIVNMVSHIAEIIGMVLLCVMVLTVSYICFTRYVLGFTPAWGEELALMCMIWFGFMAIALGVRDDGHIGVTLFDRFYPPAMLRVLNLFKYVCTCLFGLFMAHYGYKMALVGSWNKLPGLGISSYWLYIVVSGSGVAIVVYSVMHFFRHIRNRNEVLREGEDA